MSHEEARDVLRAADLELRQADRLLRLSVAAVLLNVAPKTVRKYCRCGLLDCRQLPGGQWRVRESSVKRVRGDFDMTSAPK